MLQMLLARALRCSCSHFQLAEGAMQVLMEAARVRSFLIRLIKPRSVGCPQWLLAIHLQQIRSKMLYKIFQAITTLTKEPLLLQIMNTSQVQTSRITTLAQLLRFSQQSGWPPCAQSASVNALSSIGEARV